MPDLSTLINEILIYFQANIKISAAIALVILYLLLRKTRLFFFLLFIVLLLGTIFFLISNLASTGASYKSKMVNQSTIN